MLRLLMCMWYIVIVRSTQQCKLTKSIWGRYLKGHVISKENVKSIGVCLGQCSMEPRCKSINFRFKDLTCELNDADRYTQPWDYLLEEGQAYSDYSKKLFIGYNTYNMTPSWLEAHASLISSFRTRTTDQVTFIASLVTFEAVLKIHLVAAGVLTDATPLIVEIIVANDVSIGEREDSDINYGLSDGANFIGFGTHDKLNYKRKAPCYGVEAKSGDTLTNRKSYGIESTISGTRFYPDKFVFTLKLHQSWGWCFTAHGGVFNNTAEYSKRLMLSQGLTLEVYKSNDREKVGIKYINVILMKTDD